MNNGTATSCAWTGHRSHESSLTQRPSSTMAARERPQLHSAQEAPCWSSPAVSPSRIRPPAWSASALRERSPARSTRPQSSYPNSGASFANRGTGSALEQSLHRSQGKMARARHVTRLKVCCALAILPSGERSREFGWLLSIAASGLHASVETDADALSHPSAGLATVERVERRRSVPAD